VFSLKSASETEISIKASIYMRYLISRYYQVRVNQIRSVKSSRMVANHTPIIMRSGVQGGCVERERARLGLKQEKVAKYWEQCGVRVFCAIFRRKTGKNRLSSGRPAFSFPLSF